MTPSKSSAPKTSALKYLLVLIGLFAIGIGCYYVSAMIKREKTAAMEIAATEQAESVVTVAKPTKVPIQEITTPKGLKVWLVEDKTLPILSIDFSFPGGLALQSKDEIGLAYLVSIMLDEGAGPYNSQDFQKELANNVIDLGFSAGRDHFSGSLKTLSKYQDKAFELLHLSLTEARFEETALDRMKNSTINSILRNLGSPNWNAARIFNGTVFQGHSYESPGQGNLDTIPSFKPDDLKGFAQKQFVRAGMKISVSGNISADELAEKLDSIFADLPEGTSKEQKADNAAIYKKATGKTYVFNMDIPQSIIQFAHKGISVHDPEYPAAALLEYILGGGGFSSRLMQSLREDNGLTYGIYTGLSNAKHAQLLQGQFSTKNETAAKAIQLLKEEWTKMATDGPTDVELQDAKNYLIGSFPLALTSTSKISGLLNSLQKYDRDIDYINTRTERINNVTREDVQKVATRLLKADDLSFIIVGQPQDLKDTIKVTELPGMSLPPKGQP